MWYFDFSINKCRRFHYGGCGGNENRFKTESECAELCLTNLALNLEIAQSLNISNTPLEKPRETLMTFFLGEPAELNCDAGSNAEVVWRRLDESRLPLLQSQFTIIGGKFIFRNVRKEFEGTYECSTIDGNFRRVVLLLARVVVVSPPKVNIFPQMPLTVSEGENVFILCNATGDDPIETKWERLRGFTEKVLL